MAVASVLILASPNMGPWNEDTQQDDCLDTLNVFLWILFHVNILFNHLYQVYSLLLILQGQL